MFITKFLNNPLSHRLPDGTHSNTKTVYLFYFILRNNKPLESCFPIIIPKFQYLPRFCLCLLCGNPTRVALFACKISTNQTKLEHEWCEPNLNSESQVLSCCGVLVRKGAGDCIARRDEPDAFKAPLFETQLKQKNFFYVSNGLKMCSGDFKLWKSF